jgi:hypothetical protein
MRSFGGPVGRPLATTERVAAALLPDASRSSHALKARAAVQQFAPVQFSSEFVRQFVSSRIVQTARKTD